MDRFNNIAFIYQPHFLTLTFRVSTLSQMGKKNFIIVTCSPTYNGVWTYDSNKQPSYNIYNNKGNKCYCVPIEDCTRIKTLDEIKDDSVLAIIEEQQRLWKNHEVNIRK